MRTSADKLLGLPVQWVVPVSVRRSAADQMLKYGSWASSGTAGGRIGARVCVKAANAKPLKAAASLKLLIDLFSNAPLQDPGRLAALYRGLQPDSRGANRRKPNLVEFVLLGGVRRYALHGLPRRTVPPLEPPRRGQRAASAIGVRRPVDLRPSDGSRFGVTVLDPHSAFALRPHKPGDGAVGGIGRRQTIENGGRRLEMRARRSPHHGRGAVPDMRIRGVAAPRKGRNAQPRPAHRDERAPLDGLVALHGSGLDFAGHAVRLQFPLRDSPAFCAQYDGGILGGEGLRRGFARFHHLKRLLGFPRIQDQPVIPGRSRVDFLRWELVRAAFTDPALTDLERVRQRASADGDGVAILFPDLDADLHGQRQYHLVVGTPRAVHDQPAARGVPTTKRSEEHT